MALKSLKSPLILLQYPKTLYGLYPEGGWLVTTHQIKNGPMSCGDYVFSQKVKIFMQHAQMMEPCVSGIMKKENKLSVFKRTYKKTEQRLN